MPHWRCVAGCFVNYTLLAGYLKCLSIFYVELLRRFEAQATEAALVFSVRAGVASVSSECIGGPRGTVGIDS